MSGPYFAFYMSVLKARHCCTMEFISNWLQVLDFEEILQRRRFPFHWHGLCGNRAVRNASGLHIPFILSIFCAMCIQSGATNYYVDESNSSASDSNPGTASLPWKTIAKANS